MSLKEFITFITDNNIDQNTEIIIDKRYIDRSLYESHDKYVPYGLILKHNKLLIQIGDY